MQISPKWLWTRWRKGLTSPPGRLLIGLTTRAPQVPSLLPMKLKQRVTLLYLTHKVSVKVSRRSVGGIAYRPTSKVVIPSGTYWCPPKDKDTIVSQSGTIYWFQCGDLSYDDGYIGETPRIFSERFKEHLKDSSPIHQQSNHTGHPTSQNNFQIIRREEHGIARNIKESIFIRVNNPTLNRSIGKFNLPHIWDRVLLNTPGLNFKRQLGMPIPTSPIKSSQLPPKFKLCQLPSHLLTGSEHVHRTS